MNDFERRELLGELIAMKYEGYESLVYIAEQYVGDEQAAVADWQLYEAMRRLDEAAHDMVTRMVELVELHKLKIDIS